MACFSFGGFLRFQVSIHPLIHPEDVIQADLLKDLKGLAQPDSSLPVISMVTLLVAFCQHGQMSHEKNSCLISQPIVGP